MDPLYRLPATPLAHEGAVLRGDHWRITVLTDGLVRLEWSPDGAFEDRASTLAIHRDLAVPAYDVVETPTSLEVLTERFHLTYDRGPFSPAGLQLQVRGNISSYHSVWRFGEDVDDLGGTARTLDGVDGRTPLGPGVVSRWGFAELDDSASFVFDDEGWVGRRGEGRIDLYIFAYGHDHQDALTAFYALSGQQPVLPRWALGNWWSRYYAYTSETYLELMERFQADDVPFSVAVLDMDWHPVDGVDPRYGSGWTGYSWNRDLFPDPPAFLAELHRRGLHVTLNVHPADGVRAFEDAYPEMAAALGRSTDAEAPISFDITDPEFLRAYFEILHRRLEDDGVDFWWIDWQSGHHSRIAGVDPLWMLNHFHFLDSGREGKRPMTFSRYAGPGSHRYPVGFSGDSVISWASLDFQPEFTATASNIGYGWWSHDIGGHFFGRRDDELALRWLQLGVFSPILRLHSSRNPFLLKEPWMYSGDTERAMDDALRFRHRLVPYLHTMNHRAAREGVPLVRPMYYVAPQTSAAYDVPNQFVFGSELVVAPITSPRDPISLQGKVRAWLPAGTWVDIFTGVVYDGDRELSLHRGDGSIPVLLRAGGILPLAAPDELDATSNPERLEILLAPGADGEFDLVEDNGAGRDLDTIRSVTTPIRWDQASGTLTIGTARGAIDAIPAQRTWTVRLLGVGTDASVIETSADAPAEVRFGPGLQPRTHDASGRVLDLIRRAQHGFEAKAAMWTTLTSDRSVPQQVAALQAQQVPTGLLEAVTELLTART